MPRSMTRDLMRQLRETVGLHVQSIAVDRLAKRIFYAEIALGQSKRSYQVDFRPGDAVALAVRLEAPICVDRAVIGEAACDPERNWLVDHRRGGIRPRRERELPAIGRGLRVPLSPRGGL